MTTLNALDPTPEQIKAFLAHKKSSDPVFMLNLLKYKDRATYKDGEDISGREAYARYASAFAKLLKAAGLEQSANVFSGMLNAWMIGGGEGAVNEGGEWDAVAIVRYPNAATMFQMVSSDAYRKIYKHRMAGLEGQLLISCDNEAIFK